MRSPTAQLKHPILALGFMSMFVISGGCATPPSVVPLLQLVDMELQAEALRLEEESDRDAAMIGQARERLSAGFEADLEQVEFPSVEWIRSASEAYAVAREALARHEMELQDARRRRADNLRAASEAQRRAILLLTQHDQLIIQTLGIDLWELESTRSRD